jgi:hypothetical protein
MAGAIALLVGLSAGSGCYGGPDRTDPSDVHLLRGVVDLVIGRTEGDGPDVFGRVSGVAQDSEGRIYVADALAHTIGVFGPSGSHLYTIGREGSGPGEMLRPCCIAFDRSGELWVRDRGNARYSAYTVGAAGAKYVRQLRMAHGDAGYGADLSFDASGLLIDIGHRSDPGTGRRSLHRVHLDSTGAAVEDETIPILGPAELGAVTIDRSTPDVQTYSYVYPPFGADQLLAHGPEGSFAQAVSSRYEITWVTAGVERRVVVADVAGPELTADERASATKDLTDQLSELGAPQKYGELEIPTHKPPLRDLFFDDRGRLWAQRTTSANRPAEADVYAADGSLWARREWPQGISLAAGAVYAEHALGIETDALGTQRVVRLRFVP